MFLQMFQTAGSRGGGGRHVIEDGVPSKVLPAHSLEAVRHEREISNAGR
jgi:hypothetical protein